MPLEQYGELGHLPRAYLLHHCVIRCVHGYIREYSPYRERLRTPSCYHGLTSMIFWALPLFWLSCALAGYVYSLQRDIPSSVVLTALPAFLLEATFFMSLGIGSWR